MSSSKANIKQSELIRYAKAMQVAGVEVWKLIVKPTGEQVLEVGRQSTNEKECDWDR